MRVQYLVFALFVGMIFMSFPDPVRAKDSAIIIFDGSGSMWAQVDGKAKITVARDVMNALVEDWNEDIDLGLMVYGHRKKRSCADIELMLPVGKPDADKVMTAINSIKPKGKTPISTSLQQAAETLRYTEDPATVILISDGEESCEADPCAVAKELESKGINFTAHVIGFDIGSNPEAQTQLKCVAESTGGKFFEARNAEALKVALAETAKAVAEPTPEPEPSSETGVKLSAVAAEGMEAFSKSEDARFYVYEAKKDLDGKRKQVDWSNKPAPVFQLATGEYIVSAKRGNTLMEAPITVKAGELTEHQFVLDSGNLRLKASAAESMEAFSKNEDARFYIYEAKKDLDGKRKQVNWSNKPAPVFRLSAGEYVVSAKRGNALVEAPITVKAGELTEHQFVLDSGNLQLKASAAEGAEAFSKNEDARFYVYKAKKDLDGKRKQVNWSNKPTPVFQLAAGEYFVIAKRKDMQVETTIEVKAGELTEHAFVMSEADPVKEK